MHIGIDFGTSYTAAATFVDGELTHVTFGDAKQFRTAVFFPEVVPDPTKRRVADTAAATVESFEDALFGDEAVAAYLEYGDGNLIESPKSMLGFRMDPQVRRVIVHIATYVLEHIRLAASRQLGENVRTAVIGRPVHFRSSMGEKGSEQAVEIIREAAAVAGFDSVSFLEEPPRRRCTTTSAFRIGRPRSSSISAAVPPTWPSPSWVATNCRGSCVRGAWRRAVPTST